MYNWRAALSSVFDEFISHGKLFYRGHKTCNFFNAIFHKKDSGKKGKESGEIVLYPVNIDEHCNSYLIRHENFPDVCKFCSRRRQTV